MECLILFFFNDTATTEIYTLSLHDALPICFALAAAQARMVPVRLMAMVWAKTSGSCSASRRITPAALTRTSRRSSGPTTARSEEHTSELQSRQYLGCRLLLEKKKKPDRRQS